MITAIMIVIALVLSIFAFGLMGITTSNPVIINPTIYSPNDNIGILNEQATFNITIHNSHKENLEVKIQISGDGNVIVNDTHIIPPESTDNEVIVQKLSYTGLWVVRVLSQDPKIGETYSFTTLTNNVEADGQIYALKNTQNQQDLSTYAIIISVAGLISSVAISCLSYFKPRKRLESDG
jgi:hypothetical protein